MAVTSAILYLYREEVWRDEKLKSFIHKTTFWIVTTYSLFVLTAVFISPWWWFGFLFDIPLFLLIRSLRDENGSKNILDLHANRKAIIFSAISFSVLFTLFSIPSYVVKSFNNPKSLFSNPSSFYPYAADSYILYGPETTHSTEHIIPQSWFLTDKNYVNDYINVIHSNVAANEARKDLPYGNVPRKVEYEVKSGEEGFVVGYSDDKNFMPTAQYKGDVARVVLYMYVTYKDDGLHLNSSYISLMKSWSHQDPVDKRERERNETIYSRKAYKNRLVSNPWLVGFIT